MRSIVLAVSITGSLALALGATGCREAPADPAVAGAEHQGAPAPIAASPTPSCRTRPRWSRTAAG